ncbi:hypothetical protein [Streptomyces sp. NPDC051567]|uniref:hypothetical protein n=1 Tax=Streptomyces sp. NPDC051567 TaxID=3365660 RepID=UPI0037B82B13
MLAEELVVLAAAAGTGLVQAMVTDAWQQCRDRVARLLGRGDPLEEARQEGRLERAREELTGAVAGGGDEGERAVARQAAAWGTRFEDLLEDAPDHEQPLRELLGFLREQGAAANTVIGTVTVHATASEQAQQAVQGQGTQYNTFGPGPAR